MAKVPAPAKQIYRKAGAATPVHSLGRKHLCPPAPALTIRRILLPPTIQAVLRAIRVERIEHAVHLHPIKVTSVGKAITVTRIKRPVQVRAIQKPVQIRGVTRPITVGEIIQPIPLQPLKPAQDGVTIYGSNPLFPVQTDSQGRLVFTGQIQVSPLTYTEQTFANVPFEDSREALPTQEVSLQTNLSYAIVNQSDVAVTIFLEISPNGINFLEDTHIVVSGHTLQAITPLRFLRFARITYQSYTPDTSGVMDVYYQAQSG